MIGGLSWPVLLLLAALLLMGAAVGMLFWRWRRSSAQMDAALLRWREMRSQRDALVEENARLAHFLQAVQQESTPALFLIDANRTLLWCNRAAANLCFPGAQLPLPLTKAVRMYELLDPIERVLAHAQDHAERQFMRDESTLLARAARIDGGSSAFLVALAVSDVTELQRLGRARRDFVANISHDLRTPLSAIQVMVETLQGPAGEQTERRAQLLASMTAQTATLQQLAQEMLDLSLIESGRMPLRLVETRAHDLIEPVWRLAANQAEHKHLTVAVDCDPAIRVLADPAHGRRVIQNLLHNAIKFTPEGGSITITTVVEGEDVRFAVADTGIGIEPAELTRIFERFYKVDRTRSGGEGGAGLGLAIARHIVEGHGGQIWAQSRQGEGSTFFFTLPRA